MFSFTRRILATSLVLILTACSAAGVPYTSDPYQMLAYANGLTHLSNRPLPAQGLIEGAITTFKENGDDAGLAKAYRSFATFLDSPAVAARQQHYEKYGFFDKSVTWQNRYAKAVEYLQKSRDIYARLGRADELIFTYFDLGLAYALLHEQPAACRAFADSKASYRAALAADPGFKPELPAGFASLDDYVAAKQDANGCVN